MCRRICTGSGMELNWSAYARRADLPVRRHQTRRDGLFPSRSGSPAVRLRHGRAGPADGGRGRLCPGSLAGPASRPAVASDPWLFGAIAVGFAAATAETIWSQPAGLRIASLFVLAIVMTSMVSRALRSTELRFQGFEYVDDNSRFLWDSLRTMDFPVLVPHRPGQDIAGREGGDDPRISPAAGRTCRWYSSRSRSATRAGSRTCRFWK